MMITSLLAVAALQAGSPEIVVTGVPLSQLAKEAALCEKGGCTPRDDIVATVRYAEGLFRVGRYLDSRHKLQKAITRNRVAGRSDPAALAALYEATATVAGHEGDQDVLRSATYARSRLLSDTAADPIQRILADLDVADFEAERLEPLIAENRFRNLADRARATGHPAVVARVALHHAIFANKLKRYARANQLLDGIIRAPDAPLAYRDVARAISARFARDRGDKAAVDRLLADISLRSSAQPVLVWNPKVPILADVERDDEQTAPTTSESGEYSRLRWADIGFAIRADGSVERPEVLRGSRDEKWASPLLKVIGERRYAPLAGGDADLAYRIERWTVTSDYAIPKGSLVRRRVGKPRFEQLDMTPPAPVAIAAKTVSP